MLSSTPHSLLITTNCCWSQLILAHQFAPIPGLSRVFSPQWRCFIKVPQKKGVGSLHFSSAMPWSRRTASSMASPTWRRLARLIIRRWEIFSRAMQHYTFAVKQAAPQHVVSTLYAYLSFFSVHVFKTVRPKSIEIWVFASCFQFFLHTGLGLFHLFTYE